MYADDQLTNAAEKQLEPLFVALGHLEGPDRQREFDAAVTRLHPSVQSLHKARTQALVLAGAFTLRSQQKQVYQAIEQIMSANNHVTSWEGALLMELRMKFRL
jgi:hypothetical protein